VTSRLGTGKSLTFLTVYLSADTQEVGYEGVEKGGGGRRMGNYVHEKRLGKK
jgi:hypothetical protein